MTAIQPNEKFPVFLQKCGLTSAMIICEGELCEEQIYSLALKDCLQIYRDVRSGHQIIPVLEKAILVQCYSFKDWKKVFEASSTKELHDVALIKMCELAQQPSEFASIMNRITHLDKEFIKKIFERWIAVTDSFLHLKGLWYNYANNSRYPLSDFRDSLVFKMAEHAMDYEHWKIIYNLLYDDFPNEFVEKVEDKIISLSSSMQFPMLANLALYVKTDKLSEFVSARLEELGTFTDWVETFRKQSHFSLPNFYNLRRQQMLKLATTLKDWLIVYSYVREHNDEARLKIVSLAKTYEDWSHVMVQFHWSFHHDDALATIAMQEVVDKATTWEQLNFLLGKTEHKPEFHDKILTALLELDKTLDKWANIIKWAGRLFNGDLQQKIIRIAQTQLKV